MRLEARVFGGDRARRHVREVGRRARNLRPAWHTIADLMLARERRLFDTRGRGKWRKLQPATIARKRREGDSHPARVMHASGRLERALTIRSAGGGRRGGRAQVLEERASSLRFGVGADLYYARFHPDRDVLPTLTRRERRQASRIVRHYIERGGTA